MKKLNITYTSTYNHTKMGFECPGCSRDDFGTEVGMKVHHYQSHGESIAKETAQCRECGTTFEYYPSDKEGYYCGECSEKRIWADTSHMTGDDSYLYSGGKVSVECSSCGEKIDRYPSEVNDRNYCSIECLGDGRSERYRREGHPNWKGGDIYYGGPWWSVRKEALLRDQYRCQQCFSSENQINRCPDVHHIVPVRVFDNPDDAHVVGNLICLCPQCHRAVEEKQRGQDGQVVYDSTL